MKITEAGVELEVLALRGDEPEGTQVVLKYNNEILYYKKSSSLSFFKSCVWIPETSSWESSNIDISDFL